MSGNAFPDHTEILAAVAHIASVPTILDVVCRNTGMGFAAIARVTEDRWIACGVLDGIGFGLQPGGELDVQTTICGEIREHRQPVIINNVAEDDTYCGHPTPAQYGFQSYISVPIVMPDGTFFGTLCALDPLPHILDTPAVVGSFTLFAELIAFHLDAGRRIAAAEATLSRERALSEVREQFIAVLGHDLRNPLASVSAGMQLMLRHPERAAEIAVQVGQSIARMAGLIDNVLDLARGRLGDGLTLDRDAARPLGPTLMLVIEELRSVHPGRVIEADLRLEQAVDCDHGRMAQLLSNLLGNALTHGAADGPVRVSAVARDGVFELAVANGGEPIAPAAMENLFQPFFRGASRDSQQGLGLGLYIASEIARAHGGRIEVASAADETRFTLTMPAHAGMLPADTGAARPTGVGRVRMDAD